MAPLRPDPRQVRRGRGGDALARQLLVIGRGTRSRHLHDDRAAEPEPLDERVLQGNEPRGGMDDLDADGRFSRRARSRSRPTLKRLTPSRLPTSSWVRLSR